MNTIKRIALIGPESTGKTTLCRELAGHFHSVWVPEFSRNYMETLQRPYTLDDIEYCTRQQLAEEDRLLPQANQFLFSDTELIVAKVWCEDVFHSCPPWIEQEIPKRKYDLYLLTFPDLPFTEDPVRENPHRRDYFFDWYLRELEARGFECEIVRGSGALRVENAVKSVGKISPLQ